MEVFKNKSPAKLIPKQAIYPLPITLLLFFSKSSKILSHDSP